MMQASYFDPVKDEAIETREFSENDVQDLLDTILALRSMRGHPTLELTRADGASLSLSTDGELAYLVWINSLGESFHSVGNDQREGAPLVFDYFGSWSEAPQQYLVRLEDAVQCAKTFFLTGTADTDRVLFEPDLPAAEAGAALFRRSVPIEGTSGLPVESTPKNVQSAALGRLAG